MINGKPMTTWNIYVGCDFGCTFCNARKAAETRLKYIPRYRDGFKPHFVEEEIWRRFRPGQFVMIAYMGDISFASRHEIEIILNLVRCFPQTTFLFCTKNPRCYQKWDVQYPANLYLGATIETDIDYALTRAPAPYKRYLAMASLSHPRKFISIEPVMDFHLERLVSWMKEIGPEIIEVGADNYHNGLKEPSWCSLQELLIFLKEFCPTVVEKTGLDRLKGGKV